MGWKNTLMRSVAVLVGSYGLLAGTACTFQRKLLYPAPTPPREPSATFGELLRLAAPSGRPVFALWARRSADAPTIVHFHGNGEQLADTGPLTHLLRARGVNVLSVEYPGYGLASEQDPSETSIYEAAEAALLHLHGHLGVPPAQITLQGHSLGTGVAAEMARRGHGARLALLSPYTSIPDVAARVVPVVPSGLVFDKFATARKAPDLALPVLIIHGEKDELIPASMGRELGHLFPHATVEIIAEGHHNDLFAPPHGASILDRLAAFARGILSRVAPRAPGRVGLGFHEVITSEGLMPPLAHPAARGMRAGPGRPPLLSPLHPPSPPHRTTAPAGVEGSAVGGGSGLNALRDPPLRGGTLLRALDDREGSESRRRRAGGAHGLPGAQLMKGLPPGPPGTAGAAGAAGEAGAAGVLASAGSAEGLFALRGRPG